jgi:hypothetical protein
MIHMTIETSFDAYAKAVLPRDRQRAFTELISLKALPKYADDLRFLQGLESWRSLVRTKDCSAEIRLLAIAELVRASQVVKAKKWADWIADAIAPVFSSPLPSLAALKDADERLNVARACAEATADWLPAYLANAVAEEDTGEKARVELLSALMKRVASLSEAFVLLANAFATLRFDTDAPGESMAKRMARTLNAFRPVLLASLIDAGEDAGKRFDDWIRAAFSAAGRPKDEKTQVDLTREVALTLHDLARTRFSMATQADTFAVLKQCRSFFSGISWPSELKPTMEFLVQDLSEALLVLGRQDVPQQALLDQLDLVCGIKERAKVVAGSLADKHPELPERIRDWLRRGKLVTFQGPSEALQASLLDANDAAIGVALIEARKLLSDEETLVRILGLVEIYEQSFLRSANRYAQQVREATASIVDVANRRGVSLIGREGETVDYNAKFFDTVGAISSNLVVVRRPAIVRKLGDQGGIDVILKGMAD